MARLDRLATMKALAQLGATLGREFPYALLRAVSPWDEATVQQGLHQLIEAEFLYQRGLPPQATYLFKHALIQEAAYQSLLKSIRQQHHQRIAQVLEGQFPETVETQPELLAHHYTEAGLSEQAVRYWQRAGHRASERSALVEAVAHLTRGLEILTTLPDTPERTQQELLLHTLLGPALMAAEGYQAPAVERAYTRARELCRQVGETPQLFPVLAGLWQFYLVRAEYQTARPLGEELFSVAQRIGETALLVQAYRMLGETVFHLGEIAASRTLWEQGIALYDLDQHRALALRYGGDPGVLCHSFVAFALWMLGYPDQARHYSQAALALAQERSHQVSLAAALYFAASLRQYCREAQSTHELADAAITLATEQEFPHWVVYGTSPRGWALATEGQHEEGIAQLRQGLIAQQALGAEIRRPMHMAMLAEAYGKAGRAAEGLQVLAEALAVVDRSGEQNYAAELHRLQGELQQQAGVLNEAEACFRHALDMARHQHAKSWELRASMSLGRLWQSQSKHAEARALLAPIYGWFTEGFDTADLQEAKALLEEAGG